MSGLRLIARRLRSNDSGRDIEVVEKAKVNIAADMCRDMYRHVHKTDMCTDMCTDMRQDLCTDMCTVTCTDCAQTVHRHG